MLDFTNARVALKIKLPQDRAFDDEALAWALDTGAKRVWRAKPWKFAERPRGQIITVADYTTGYVTDVAALGTTITFSGTALDNTFIGRFVRIAGNRDYEITAVGSSTSCTIRDPYEDDAIVATNTAFRISKKIHYLPGDYANGFMWKESISRTWLGLIDRQKFERLNTDPNQTGQAALAVEAGFSIAPMATAGTISLTPGSATVTGTSTAFDSRMKNLPLVVDGFPTRFNIETVTDTTHVVLDRPWPYESQALATYQVAPAGCPLVEFYPVHNVNGSIELFYYRKPPEFSKGSDRPQWYEDFDDLWLDAAMWALGLMDEMLLKARIDDMAQRDGIEREGCYSIDAPGGTGHVGEYVGSQGARIWWGN